MLAALALVPLSALCADGGDAAAEACASFDPLTCDLGYIKEANGAVRCQFSVKNTGEAPLVIIDVKPSCGCTEVDYPTHPIVAGDSAVIEVEFTPTGFRGGFKKDIKVRTNGTKRRTTLYIEGSVIPKK